MLDNKGFDFVGVDILRLAGMGAVFIPAAVVPGYITLFVRAGVPDIGSTAFFTFDQARQQVTVAGFIFCVSLVVLHSGLHLLPCIVVNDPGDCTLYPLHVGVRLAARPFPHDFVFLLVPGVDAYVPFILQQTVQAVLPDRAPTFAHGALQVVDNIVVAFPSGIPGKDVPDDRGLCWVDHVLAVDNIITERRDATEEGSLFRLHGDTVNRLLTAAQDFNLAHADGDQFRQKVGAVCEIAQFLPAGADHLDTQVHHGLAEAEPIADVAAAAAYVVNDHDAKFPPVRSRHQSLEPFAVCVGAAARFILEGGDDLDAVFSCVFPDLRLLVRYAVFGLIVR